LPPVAQPISEMPPAHQANSIKLDLEIAQPAGTDLLRIAQ
jgi:hypothetical protein